MRNPASAGPHSDGLPKIGECLELPGASCTNVRGEGVEAGIVRHQPLMYRQAMIEESGISSARGKNIRLSPSSIFPFSNRT